jgi:hypothetical protein
VISFN